MMKKYRRHLLAFVLFLGTLISFKCSTHAATITQKVTTKVGGILEIKNAGGYTIQNKSKNLITIKNNKITARKKGTATLYIFNSKNKYKCIITIKSKTEIKKLKKVTISNSIKVEKIYTSIVYHYSETLKDRTVMQKKYSGEKYLVVKKPGTLNFSTPNDKFFAGWICKNRKTDRWCLANDIGNRYWGSYDKKKLYLFSKDGASTYLNVEYSSDTTLDFYAVWLSKSTLDLSHFYYNVSPLSNKSYTANKNYDVLTRKNLQKALNKASELSKSNNNKMITVYIPGGTYEVNEFIKIPSNIKLQMDSNTILKRGKNWAIGKNGPLLLIGENVVTIDAVTKEAKNPPKNAAYGYGQASNIEIVGGHIINDNYGRNYDGAAVRVHHAGNIKFINCKFSGFSGKHAVVVVATNGILIDHCIFDGTKTKSAPGYQNLIDTKPTSECNAEALHLDNATYMDAAYPFDKTVTTNIVITDNQFKNCVSGIGCHAYWSEGFIKMDVENNTFDNIKFYCVDIYYNGDVYVSGNNMVNCTSPTFNFVRKGKLAQTVVVGMDTEKYPDFTLARSH